MSFSSSKKISGPLEDGSFRLSCVLTSQSYSHNLRRLSAVEKLVSIIDPVSGRYLNAETFYASNNLITSLSGIGQFHKLRILSLTNNRINDIRQLADLSKLLHLETLSLEKNPVVYYPFYRLHVIRLCPSLRSLDTEVCFPSSLSCH